MTKRSKMGLNSIIKIKQAAELLKQSPPNIAKCGKIHTLIKQVKPQLSSPHPYFPSPLVGFREQLPWQLLLQVVDDHTCMLGQICMSRSSCNRHRQLNPEVEI